MKHFLNKIAIISFVIINFMCSFSGSCSKLYKNDFVKETESGISYLTLDRKILPILIVNGNNTKEEVLFINNVDINATIKDLKIKIKEKTNIPLYKQCLCEQNEKTELFGNLEMWALYKKDTGLISLHFYNKKSILEEPLKNLLNKYNLNSDATYIAFGASTTNSKTAEIQQFPDFFSQAAEKNPYKKFTVILIDGLFKTQEPNLPTGLSKKNWEKENWKKINDEQLNTFFRIYQQKNVTVLVFPYSLKRTEETRNEPRMPVIQKNVFVLYRTEIEQNITAEEDPLIRVFSCHIETIIKDDNKKIFFSHCDNPREMLKEERRPLDFFDFITDEEDFYSENIYAYSPWIDYFNKDKDVKTPKVTPQEIIFDKPPKINNENVNKKPINVTVLFLNGDKKIFFLNQGKNATVKNLKETIQEKEKKQIKALLYSGISLIRPTLKLTDISPTEIDEDNPIFCVLK